VPLRAKILGGRPRTAPAPGRRPQFEVVLRGYDRTAVDAYLDGHAGEWQSLRHELDNSERRRQQDKDQR